MAWIESHQSLKDHPKTKRAARKLGIGVPALIGHLHCLWWWALEYAPDGNLAGFDAEDIAEAALWDGEPARFVTALMECGPGDHVGFLDTDEDGNLLVHDWQDYAGKLIERRRSDAARKRGERVSEGAPLDVQRTSDGPPQDGAQTAYVPYRTQPTNTTVPNRTVQNPTMQEGFDDFWRAYPRKAGKPKTRDLWEQRRQEGVSVEEMVSAAANYAERVRKAKTQERYVKLPSTFLGSDRCWEDYAEPPPDDDEEEEHYQTIEELRASLAAEPKSGLTW